MKNTLQISLVVAAVLPASVFALSQVSRAQYLPPDIKGSHRTVGRPATGEFALDVCGGRDKVYLQANVDPTNINLLWSVQHVGEYVMFVSRVDGMALDAAGGEGNPYPRTADPSNINHLWLLAKVGDHYMIWSAVSNVVLDAAGGRGWPYLSRTPDPRNINHLWSLRPVGTEFMIVPKVTRAQMGLTTEILPRIPYRRTVDQQSLTDALSESVTAIVISPAKVRSSESKVMDWTILVAGVSSTNRAVNRSSRSAVLPRYFSVDAE